MKTMLLAVVSLALGSVAVGAERECFDFDWRFAKFGKFADCLAAVEPGAPVNCATASSQEGHNPAVNAIDGNPKTRWCAANSQPASFTIDFGREVSVVRSEVLWENAARRHYTIFFSRDGKQWQKVLDQNNGGQASNADAVKGTLRYARIHSAGSAGAWTSIREWTFFDAQGKAIVPVEEDVEAPQKPQEIGFDDSAWRKLDVPHDWGIESDFISNEPNETGKLPWNAIGWYRKTFTVPATDAGKQIFLDFDGVMMEPRVYVNGQLAGEWAYGYASFRVDITKFVKFGKANLVAVRAENKPLSTRWYPGAGIYRHVWLVKANPVCVDQWGVFVSTEDIQGIASADGKTFTAKSAVLKAPVTVKNTTDRPVSVVVSREVPGLTGATLAPVTVDVPANGTATAEGICVIKGSIPLWDMAAPARFKLVTTLKVDGKVVDTVETPFGIRKAEWRADGFYLNDRRVQIHGVCQHHDMGPLGAAVHTRALERQIEILKSFGVNSIRTSHNPPAPELLELCDKMGVLVDNELFDIWKLQKYGKSNGYHVFWDKWWQKDVRNFVCRDRNHPCVIAWSAGNEIDEQGNIKVGHPVAKELVAEFKKWDNTRSVTVGCNDGNAWRNGFGEIFDVYGFNYKPKMYPDFEKKFSNQPYVASETSSCLSSRGIYHFPEGEDYSKFWNRNFSNVGPLFFTFQISSYDLYATGWSYAPDIEFLAHLKAPRCAGEYVWTGFDYIGEPTPWNQDPSIMNNFRNLPPAEQAKKKAELDALLKTGAPSRSSYFGIVDLCGFWKDRTFLYQSYWMPEVPMAHILPHWNWVGRREGKLTPVFVYTSGDSAELFLNGKSLGKRTKTTDAQLSGGDGKDMSNDALRERFRLTWMNVRYEPGTLKVVAYKNGKVWAEETIETTGEPTKIVAKADRSIITGDGRDLSYITIDLHDAKGRFVPTATPLLNFTTTGPIEIVGVCNGDPTDSQSMKKPFIHAFSGKAQVIVRSIRGKQGVASVKVASDGLPSVMVPLTVQ